MHLPKNNISMKDILNDVYFIHQIPYMLRGVLAICAASHQVLLNILVHYVRETTSHPPPANSSAWCHRWEPDVYLQRNLDFVTYSGSECPFHSQGNTLMLPAQSRLLRTKPKVDLPPASCPRPPLACYFAAGPLSVSLSLHIFQNKLQ